VGRQEEAWRVAEEVLADIELKRLKTSEIALKANRVARIVRHEALTEFLGYERDGYSLDGSANDWIGRAGRWSSGDEDKFFPQSIAKIDALLAGAHESLESLRAAAPRSAMIGTLLAKSS
jgi:hypothetical protein